MATHIEHLKDICLFVVEAVFNSCFQAQDPPLHYCSSDSAWVEFMQILLRVGWGAGAYPGIVKLAVTAACTDDTADDRP